MTYVLWTVRGGHCVIVDCGDTPKLLEDLYAIGIKPIAILLTHVHYDHIYGLNDFLSAFPDVRIYTNEWGHQALMSDKLNLSKYHGNPFVLSDESAISKVSNMDCDIKLASMHIHAVSTPGHNPSCITYYTEDFLFTGDSYIPDTPVVTFLPHSNRQEAEHSVYMIRLLSKGRKVMPGHFIGGL